MNKYLGDFFVGQARLNGNSFGGYAAEQTSVIENYQIILSDDYVGAAFAFCFALLYNKNYLINIENACLHI